MGRPPEPEVPPSFLRDDQLGLTGIHGYHADEPAKTRRTAAGKLRQTGMWKLTDDRCLQHGNANDLNMTGYASDTAETKRSKEASSRNGYWRGTVLSERGFNMMMFRPT